MSRIASLLLFVVCAIIIGAGCGSEPETGPPSEKLVGYCPVVESSPKCYDIEMVDNVEEAFYTPTGSRYYHHLMCKQ